MGIFLQISEGSISIMHTPTILLFIGLSCICPVLADRESVDCSGVSLADVRRVIPEDVVSAKNFLYKIWKLRKQDLCQLPFAELHNADIFYKGRKTFQRKSNEKATIRNIIKYQIKDLVKDYEQSIWRFWVNNDGSSQMPGRLEGWKSALNQSLQRQLEEIDLWSFEFLVDALFNELEELVPNLDFLKTFTLNSQDVENAIKGFVCSWQNERSADVLELFLPDGFDEVVSATGAENIDIDNIKAVVKAYMKDVIALEVTPFLTKQIEKFKSLMYDLVPLFSEFHMMKNRLAEGEQIELENLLIKSAGSLDNIVDTVENLFNTACYTRNNLMNMVFYKSTYSFFHLAGQRINENKKIDFKGLIEILTETGDAKYYIITELGRLDKFIDQQIASIEKGDYGFAIVHFLVKLVSPDLEVPRGQWKTYEERYNIRTEVLQAGAIEFLVDYLIFPIRP